MAFRSVKKIIIVVAASLIASVACVQKNDTDPTKPFAYLDQDKIIFAETDTFSVNAKKQTVKLANIGGSDLLFIIDDTAIKNSDFSYSNNCSGVLKQNENCVFDFSFSPTKVDAQSQTLYIKDLVNSTTSSIHLTGSGKATTFTTEKLPDIKLSSRAVTFPETLLYSSSATKRYVIENSSASDLALTFELTDTTTIKTSDINLVFQLASNCENGGVLPAKSNCYIDIIFAPKTLSQSSANLTIKLGASSYSVALNGQALTQIKKDIFTEITGLYLNMKEIDFGSVTTDVNRYTKAITLYNRNIVPMELEYLLADESAVFAIDTMNAGCVINNASEKKTITVNGASCELSFSFSPISSQNYRAELTLKNSLGAQHKINLSGFGKLDSKGIIFDNTTATYPQRAEVIYTNETAFQQTISLIEIKGANATAFSITEDESSCKNRKLLTNESCKVAVDFDPTGDISFAGEIVLSDSSMPAKQFAAITIAGSKNIEQEIKIVKPASMIKSINLNAAATIGQKTYLFGGAFDNSSSATNLLSVYDFATNKFTTLRPYGNNPVQDLTQKTGGYVENTNIMVRDGKIIVYGAVIRVQNNFITSDSIYIYDPNDKTLSKDGAWSILKPATDTGRPKAVLGISAALFSDRLYAAEGVPLSYYLSVIQDPPQTVGLVGDRFSYFDFKTLTWNVIDNKIKESGVYPDFEEKHYRFAPSLIPFKDSLMIFGGVKWATQWTTNDDATPPIKSAPAVFYYGFDRLKPNAELTLYSYKASDNLTRGDALVCDLVGGTTPVVADITGPCRAIGAQVLNINDQLFTLGGAKTNANGTDMAIINSGIGISGPWKYTADEATFVEGVWKNIESTKLNTDKRGPAKLINIDNNLLFFENDNASVYLIEK